jgi:hypothetical protein
VISGGGGKPTSLNGRQWRRRHLRLHRGTEYVATESHQWRRRHRHHPLHRRQLTGTAATLTLANTLTSVEQVLLAGSGNISVNAKRGNSPTALPSPATTATTPSPAPISPTSSTAALGNDTLIGGGTGDDTLLGGLGNDTFTVALGSHHGAAEVINGQEGTDAIAFVGRHRHGVPDRPHPDPDRR